jgi:hypothetical protein
VVNGCGQVFWPDGVAVWRRVSVSVPREGGIFLGVASACHAARFLTG